MVTPAPSVVLVILTWNGMADLLPCLSNVTGTLWNLGLAWGAGRLAHAAPVAATRLWLERLLGAMFVTLGARLALSERS